jgi:hypothetical protein
MKTFTVEGKVWRYPGLGGWHFVYVNKAVSQKIKDATRNKKKVGFQFIRVRAQIGTTTWTTTLFPTKDGPYLLAVKADVRKKEDIADGDTVKASCTLL